MSNVSHAHDAFPMVIVDFEASSLGDNSYPVEVGWAVIGPELGIVSDALPIRPARGWSDWSPKSEALHGFSREALAQLGVSPAEAVAALEAAVSGSGTTTLCADPEFDGFWADRLYAAAGVRRSWQIAPLRQTLDSLLLASTLDHSWLKAALNAPRPHRAEQDARSFAEIVVALKRAS